MCVCVCERVRAFTPAARMSSRALSAHVTYSGRRRAMRALDAPAGAASDRSMSGAVSLRLGEHPRKSQAEGVCAWFI